LTAATLTESPGETAAPALPAAGSSFYLAMRILPRRRREGMYAVYAFCRAVDDVADGEGPRDERLAALARWRADIDTLYGGHGAAARLDTLREAVRQFGLRREDFHAVIEGMAMDVTADMRAPDWATLDLYCDRVASAVGRLSTRIFGLDDEPGTTLAHHLGRALQLTNILRDVDEDAALGRLYLPREALVSAGIEAVTPDVVLRDARLGVACAEVASRAEQHFTAADRIMATCPRDAVRAPRLMAAAYGSILWGLRERGWRPPRPRVSTDKLRLIGAVLRYGLF
jgi:presqualene diphosphate synthase